MNDANILISSELLQRTVAHLAARLNAAYADSDTVMALVILEGARCFADDLLKQVSFPITVETLKASSYAGTNSTGSIDHNGHDGLRQRIRDKHILIIDDIYDTGRTLSHLLAWVESGGPKSVKTCVLLEKQIPHEKEVCVDFVGTTVPDVFVVGYGLDYNGRCRELPYIAELAPHQIEE